MNILFVKKWAGIAAAGGAMILAFVYPELVFDQTGAKYAAAKVMLGGQTFFVDVAKNRREFLRGLSGRDSIPEFGGMLFEFDEPGIYSFWMKDMRFPIDIIWLNQKRVVFLTKNAKPPRPEAKDAELEVFTPDEPVDEVVEVKAGTIDRFNIRIGDKINIILH